MTRARIWLCLAGLAVGALPAAWAGEACWPQFRGPHGDGHADADLPTTWSETQHVRWKTPLHGRAWSSPVIQDGQAWMGTATEDGRRLFALCVDVETGALLHDLLLFEVDQPQEIHSLNSYASSTPVIEPGRVYLHFGSAGTACLDTRSGAVLWQRNDLPCWHYRGPGSSPILWHDLLIVHLDGHDYQYVVALDKTSGEVVWKTDRAVDYGTDDGDVKKAFATPLIIEAAGRTQLISPTSKAVLAYDPATGGELWRVRIPEFSATARPLFGHGLVFLNTGFGKAQLWAVEPTGLGDVTETHVVWKLTENVGSMPSPLLVEDLLYLVSDTGIASCVEALTGEVVWTERLGGNFSASPLYARGRLYFCDQEGRTTVLATGREFQELAVNALEHGCMASPAVAGDALLLRTTAALYRIEN